MELAAIVGDTAVPHPLDDLLPVPEGAHNHPVIFEIDFHQGLDCDWSKVDYACPEELFPGLPVTLPTHAELPYLNREGKLLLAQSWVFYGLLSNIFGRCIRKRDVFSNNRLCRSKLTDLLRPWHSNLCQQSKSDQEQYIQQLRQKLQIAAIAIDLLDVYPTRGGEQVATELDYPVAATILCVKLFIEYMSEILDAHLFRSRTPELHHSRQPWFQKSLKVADNVVHAYPGDFHKADEFQQPKIWFLAMEPGTDFASTFTRRLLRTWFGHHGWCLAVVRSLHRENYSTWYYLARIARLEEPGKHRRCEEEHVCRAYDLTSQERQLYQPKHSISCDGSCPVLPKTLDQFEEKLHDIIRDNKIPMLSIKLGADDLDLSVEAYDGTQRYTAISHVWGDGMGNDRRNQVHQCQLRKISFELDKLRRERIRNSWMNGWSMYVRVLNAWPFRHESRLLFWLDTICIPPRYSANISDQPMSPPGTFSPAVTHLDSDECDTEPEDNQPSHLSPLTSRRKLRDQAMRHITPIFQAAQEVLVLDRELEQLEHPTNDLVTAIILGGKWSHRAWTFQEGSSAQACRFKLGAGAPAFLRDMGARDQNLWDARCFHDGEPVRSSLSTFIKRIFRSRLHLGKPVTPIESQISQFWMPLKSKLRKQLNESRKNLTSDGMFVTVTPKDRDYHLRRLQTLIDVWNDLRGRNATRPTDAFIIFANLLDFDATGLGQLESRYRLPVIMKSCKLVPLSLMFNTQTVIYKYHHISDRREIDGQAHDTMNDTISEIWPRQSLWIPSEIQGDETSSGDFLEVVEDAAAVTTTTMTPGWLRLDLWEEKWEYRHLALTSGNPAYGEFNSRTLSKVHIKGEGIDEVFVVECFLPHSRLKRRTWLQEQHNEPPRTAFGPRVVESDRARLFHQYKLEFNKGQKVLYILDLSFGMSTLIGYRGRGARFSVLEDDGTDMRVEYDCPVKFWTLWQWDHLQSRGETSDMSDDAAEIEAEKFFCEKGKRTIYIKNGKAFFIHAIFEDKAFFSDASFIESRSMIFSLYWIRADLPQMINPTTS